MSPKAAKDLERQGRNLWNLCVRLKRDERDDLLPNNGLELLARARVFAFQIISLGREGGRAKKNAESEIVYLMNLALTAGRLCVVDSDLEAARTVLQKAAEYVEELRCLPDGTSRDSRSVLEAEYLAMRTALVNESPHVRELSLTSAESWKENNLDVAEHMFAKIDALRQNMNVASTEIVADTLQHIGVDLSSKGNHPIALRWLKRAYEFINTPDLEQLSSDGLELRLAIYQSLIQSLLGIGSSECVQEADDLAAYVESEVGDRPVVLHWRLEIMQKSPGEVFGADAYSSILRRMIRSFDFSDGTFNFLLHHIKELRDRSSNLACGVMDELFKQKVLQSGNTEWVSKAIVRRLWMATMEHDSDLATKELGQVLDLTLEATSEPVSPDVVGAAHSVGTMDQLDCSRLIIRAYLETRRSFVCKATLSGRGKMVFDSSSPSVCHLRRGKQGEVWKEADSLRIGS